MSPRHRKPTARHRKHTASAKKVAKIAFTGAGSQRADHGGSGGRSAGAHAGYPLSVMPVEAQYIVRAGALAVALGLGAAVTNTPAVAFAESTDTSSSSSSSGSTPKTTTGQPTENTTDTTNQANDSEPDTPANTSAPEPSAPEPSAPEPSAPEPPAPEPPVAEPDAVSDLKPHVSEPETSVAEPGVVSATEIEVRATKSAQPTKSRKSAKFEPPATAEAEPPAVKQPAVAESANVAVQPSITPPSADPPSTPSPVAPIAKTIVDSVQEIVKDPEIQPPAPGEVKDFKEVVSNVLGVVGLNPFASNDPGKPPVDSPAMWAMLAFARKRRTWRSRPCSGGCSLISNR